MISMDELSDILEGTRWGLLSDEEATAKLAELRREMPPGHVLEHSIERVRFVAGDGGSDDDLLVVEGSDQAAYGIHLTYTGHCENIAGVPAAWPLETIEDVRGSINGEEFG